MKKFTTYLLLGFVVMFLFTYIAGINDDAYARLYPSSDIIGSLKYYVLWVLPYWWLIIIIGRKGGFATEGQPTQRAQRAGHTVGYPIFQQKQSEREWKKATNPWPKW